MLPTKGSLWIKEHIKAESEGKKKDISCKWKTKES